MQIGPYAPGDIADQLRDSASRYCGLIPAVRDEHATGPHTPDWEAGDIVRHTTFLPGYYAGIMDAVARLAPEATEMRGVNEDNLATISGFPVADAPDRIRSEIDELARRVTEDPSRSVPFHGGSSATLAQLGCIAIGEYEIHGVDLASSVGASWKVSPDAAAMTILGAFPAAADVWVDRAATGRHTGAYDLRLRGKRGACEIVFDEGSLTVVSRSGGRPSRRVDTVISARPSAMLRVFYGRQSQWDAMARGQIFAWGIRPWKALTLRRKFLPI